MNQDLFNRVHTHLEQQDDILLSGLSGSARAFFLHEIFRTRRSIIYLAANEEKAYDLSYALKKLLGPDRVFHFFLRDFVFMKENMSTVEVERIVSLQHMLLHPRRTAVYITTPGGMLYHILSPQDLRDQFIQLAVEQEQPQEELLSHLIQASYERVDTVTRPGQVAIRGGIVDIFPVGTPSPYRLEYFGDEIETIKEFNVDTQRSGRRQQKIMLPPADELSRGDYSATLLDYLPAGLVFFDEPREFYKALERQSKRYQDYRYQALREEKELRELKLTNRSDMLQALEKHPIIYHSFFPGSIPQVEVSLYEHIAQKEMEPFQNRYETVFERINTWLENGYTVQASFSRASAKKQFMQDLTDQHISAIEFIDQHYEDGFVSNTFKIALITEKDLWGKRSVKKAAGKKQGEAKLLIEDLQLGDYVVHESYGIGIFRGVTREIIDGVTREYILLQYAGTDRLYLPVDKLDLLHKYSSSEEREPRLNKLSGAEWERTRAKVASSIQDMAEDLLLLYAERQATQGFAFSKDTPWQAEFETDFPYQETPDQLQAIIEVKKDMEKRRPMDRLVCGDVGYGKTEVAMRAAFKAILDGKQVAILVPTTVLAEQHYYSFIERFENYPTNIEVLSRFKTASQQKKILQALEMGGVDIIIGTHRLLSRDVHFKDLGLLVIDEEHRFGVAQKEKIKALKKQLDVLSLSATPIPRSLHMSLTGLRDLSVIETPPPARYPVATYVMEYNQEIVREAILNEMERGGQVFFVHNRIQDINRVREELEGLVPEAEICIGHGRMGEGELSQTLMDFVNGQYDVLLCTTIIESGLDMPNVNTIIIDQADHMGLAQLYQLRGRVGRSSKLAYAYLTYRPDKVLTEEAQKRLNAIREFNELGAGMKIALRDLEIRGAGNILGPEQHGYIHAVGFDLYLSMLEEEAGRLQGQTPRATVSPQVDIDIDYYIPDAYIPDSGSKMRLYRRVLLAADQDEIQELRTEMEDRFGPVPQPVDNLLQIAGLRIQASQKEIRGLRRKGKSLEIQTVHPLPPTFIERTRHLQVKKVNEHTVLLRPEGTSLDDLQGLIQSL